MSDVAAQNMLEPTSVNTVQCSLSYSDTQQSEHIFRTSGLLLLCLNI